MAVAVSLMSVLQSPDAENIWTLRGDLLQAGVPSGDPVMSVLERYHNYMHQLASSMTARDFSHFASLLDVAGIGGVVTETLIDAEDRAALSRSLLGAVLSEGLMILATRQHVKAWEAEAGSLYRMAAWGLYPEIWALSRQLRPQLTDSERRKLLDGLFQPVLSDELEGSVRAVLIGRLFQLVLICGLADWLKGRNQERSGDPE